MKGRKREGKKRGKREEMRKERELRLKSGRKGQSPSYLIFLKLDMYAIQ